jgi:hypothetical protein
MVNKRPVKIWELLVALLVVVFGKRSDEYNMPIILLWTGIPILLLGGGYVVYRVIGG